MPFILHNKLDYSIIIKNIITQKVDPGYKVQLEFIKTEIFSDNKLLLKVDPIGFSISTLILTESNSIFIYNQAAHQRKIKCVHDGIESIIKNQYYINVSGTKSLSLVDQYNNFIISIEVQPEYLNGYDVYYNV